ncbi:hypothetical protein O6H91_19G081400 [Diphasiastrum complanatum]|uniref:Uncharacterized protein n=1 Tax=Diphasiastrum complanatum TaxID=34168 RepID=A0ACC2AYA4_DIPCM|nr:hypothetical protein O6H91_19G081400 [Diphasiastrum complanatum]
MPQCCLLNLKTLCTDRSSQCCSEATRKAQTNEHASFFVRVEGRWSGRGTCGSEQRMRNYSCKGEGIDSVSSSSLAALRNCDKQRWTKGEVRFLCAFIQPNGDHGNACRGSRFSKRKRVLVQVVDEFGGDSGGSLGGGHGGFSGGGYNGPGPRGSGGGDESDRQRDSFRLEWLILMLRARLGCFAKQAALAFITTAVALGSGMLLFNCSEGLNIASALTRTSFEEVAREPMHSIEEQKGDIRNGSSNSIWEIKRGQWTRFLIDRETDEFIPEVTKGNEEEAMLYESSHGKSNSESSKYQPTKDMYASRKKMDPLRYMNASIEYGLEVLKQLMLPEGYPKSVTADYTEYTIWRMGQIIASQISGVLTTQALLYAVGLGKGAIPTAAAVNWVLRDGIGYLSKIALSKYGRHFDVHPKGWRLLSDILENVSNGLELLTPMFPHLFVFLGASAGAVRSAAGLIQAATRSCFYAGFAAQQNFAEVIAKGEAQGMVSKSVGIALGLGISSHVGASGPLLVVTFVGVTIFHVVCNLKSYQAVQLHTLNTYRASLLMLEYLHSGNVLSVKDVNDQEPIFSQRYFRKFKVLDGQAGKQCLLTEVHDIAADAELNLELGVMLKDLVNTKSDAVPLLELYRNEQYILLPVDDKMKVVLKEAVSPRDLLRAVLQISYLYQGLNQQGRLEQDISKWARLQRSYHLMQENFEKVKRDLEKAGWIADGLIARSGSHRLMDQ